MVTLSPLAEKVGELISELQIAKGKIAELEAKTNNRRKLRPTDVAQIRRLASETTKTGRRRFTHQEIADIYDVNRATVSRTIRGEYH